MWANLKFRVFMFSIFFLIPVFSQSVADQGNNPVDTCCASFENEKIKYFKENQYSGFVDFLDNYKIVNKSNKSCINYYKALARFTQLSYLEEKQSWDDYFANGNNYRDQIVDNTKKVIAETNASDCLRPKSRLLVWQFHRGQQDAFHGQALIDLIIDVKAYAGASKDAPLVKHIADSLLSSGEKSGARELYKFYVQKLLEDKITDLELKTIAAGFYKEGNLELAQSVYDIYIEKVAKDLSPDKFIQELFEIVSLFVYKPTGLYDMPYAEKIYERIDALGQENVFNQEQIYLRAFNLEKMKEYRKAREFYLQLIQLYAETKHFDEAAYKIAMIDAYVLTDIKEARSYFENLVAKLPITPQVISSFYQLGLFSQWEGDLVKAKDYYSALVKNSGDAQKEIAKLAKARLQEIEENKPLEYNLKTFLDLSFKDASNALEMGRSELVSDDYILDKDQKTAISSLVNMPASGCNQVELQYLWSGNLGQATPSVSNPGFECAYSDFGTKETNLVLVSTSGIIDHTFIMVDVY